MPRTGTGSAAQVPDTTAVAGEVIRAQKYNSAMTDIYSLFSEQWPLALSQPLSALGGQPLNANLTSLSTLGTAAGKLAYTTGAGVWAETAFPAWARAFNGVADLPAARTYFYDNNIKSISNLPIVAGDTLYSTGTTTFGRLPKGSAGQTLRMNSGATAPEWGSAAIGEGQSWYDLTASRAMATIYQNTTGRPIQVNVFASADDLQAASIFVFEVDNVTPPVVIAGQGHTTDYSGQIGPISVIIPPSHYYRFRKINGLPSTFTLRRWSELR